MPNREGFHGCAFDYFESQNAPRTARTMETHLTGPLNQFCHDAEWTTQAGGAAAPWSQPWERLTYMDWLGNIHTVKMHCTEYGGRPGMIRVTIDVDGNNVPSNTIQILDWDRTRWTVTIQSLVDNHATPGVTLNRV
jgi:hypothetical protein